uniref:RNA 2',3'-cyclic phosphodiesterase n=1 Tax=Mesoaciditoga lauensis TaxID=1495039 RepID=A0A7V3REY8_9BACT
MRTFMAIEVSKEVSEKISDIQIYLKSNDFFGSWPSIDNAHLTLFFFGDLENGKIEKVKDAMDESSKQFEKFSITVEGTGIFPSKGLPRVVWMGCNGNEISDLYFKIEGVLKKKGFVFENRFTPHLTIGRLKGLPKNWSEVISQIQYEPLTFECDEISLFSSTLTPKGSIYRSIHKSELGG